MRANLFQEDDVSVDVEPNSGIAAQGWLVSPACVDATVTPKGAEFVANRMRYSTFFVGRGTGASFGTF
ncbi:hypothetical protein [Pseudoclavibacter sp. AY1F1]|uniref:hypothetical protein n=1 Tax=Pseudoclavibacter sp. AY1F1 TaxID=2080583 RepID=UPI0011B00DCA|nr:hypothetical protein [Pseudoclavibacter sp. AY1F1]